MYSSRSKNTSGARQRLRHYSNVTSLHVASGVKGGNNGATRDERVNMPRHLADVINFQPATLGATDQHHWVLTSSGSLGRTVGKADA